MSLRSPSLADASSIAAISIEVWIGTYLKRGVTGIFADYVLETFTTAATERLIADPAQFMLVSENQQGIDGFIRISAGCPAPVAGCSDTEIATFYVQPRHHGKGIGKRLLRAAMDQCRAQGITAVWLATNAENTPAIAFYLAQGFTHVGETYFTVGTDRYLNNVYALALD